MTNETHIFDSYFNKEKPPDNDPNALTRWWETKNQRDSEKSNRELLNTLYKFGFCG